MIRYLTAHEVAALYRRPVGTIYWLASRDRWRRADRRRPTLYASEDVEQSFTRLRESSVLT